MDILGMIDNLKSFLLKVTKGIRNQKKRYTHTLPFIPTVTI